MTIYIDPPLWPAHGTVYSHLTSDESLIELHIFAREQGLPWQAFDIDHFDVPERKYESLVAAGAVPVTANALTRILIESGMRVPAQFRGDALAGKLLVLWMNLLPSDGDAEGWRELGVDLLGRWNEPHRKYHNVRHLKATLDALNHFDLTEQDPRVVRLAAWFHDAIYEGKDDDEERSAQLAESLLSGWLAPKTVSEVARLVRMTKAHDPGPEDLIGGVLSDADLAILAAEPLAYQRYLIGVRSEYAHVSDADFAKGRAQVLQALIDAGPLFKTKRGASRHEDAALNNLHSELEWYAEGLPVWLQRD